MKELKQLIRPNIWSLTPYSSARSEYISNDNSILLDANENPYNNATNRYPDPLQKKLKQELSVIKGITPEQIFLGNGSDEAIDLSYRIFCNPGRDNVVSIWPSYGMYKTCADINQIEFRPVELNEHFDVEADKVLKAVGPDTKLIFLCSPNNPSGNCLNENEVEKIIHKFNGIVILDEAYSDFTLKQTFRERLNEFPNLIVYNTMSKAWGCAGIRLGMAFAQKEIIDIFNKVKYPYNVNVLTQQKALDMTNRLSDVEKWIKLILEEREALMDSIAELPICEEIYPTDANFFLVKMPKAEIIYQYLVNSGVIVRDRTKMTLCRDCLRITVGSPVENNALLAALRKYKEV